MFFCDMTNQRPNLLSRPWLTHTSTIAYQQHTIVGKNIHISG